MRTITLFLAAAAVSLCFSQNTQAGQWHQQLTLTFGNPVEIPGHVLEPGTYLFEVGIGDSSQYENIVRVYNQSHSHLYGMFLTIPDRRLTRTSKPVLEFAKPTPASPEAIYAWFYPNDKTGHEFVYPRSEAARLAQANNRPVASMPDTTNIADESALKQAHVKAVTPAGQDVETITVFGRTAD